MMALLSRTSECLLSAGGARTSMEMPPTAKRLLGMGKEVIGTVVGVMVVASVLLGTGKDVSTGGGVVIGTVVGVAVVAMITGD